MIQLIIGGARSGKSRFAENRVAELASQGYECHYLATALGLDDEMRERIQRHQQDRLDSAVHWHNHEVGIELGYHLKQLAAPERVLLVDCLTLWLTGLLCQEDDEYRNHSHREPAQAIASLCGMLAQLPGEILLVSNEVGSGIVPLGELSRQFVDEAGRLNQAVAALADRVTLVVAGLPLQLK